MKDILQDVVAHTHALGFLPLVKVTSDSTSTMIESMAEDRSVILSATTHTPVAEVNGTFGMPNLDKLALHLKNPEYKTDAKLQIVEADRNGETIPTHIHFENAAGDFENYITASCVFHNTTREQELRKLSDPGKTCTSDPVQIRQKFHVLLNEAVCNAYWFANDTARFDHAFAD